MRRRIRNVGAAIYSKKKGFAGRDSIGWAKLFFFYAVFYALLATLFIVMMFILMAITPKDRPRYILGQSTMAVLTPLNPGLGFRPQIGQNLELIAIYLNESGQATASKDPYVNELKRFLAPYHNGSTQIDCTDLNSLPSDRSQFSCQFKLNTSFCDESSSFGYDDGEPCVLIKLNRIYGWTSNGSASCPMGNDRSDGRGSILGPGDIRIKCEGETAGDIDVISNIRYFSHNGDSQVCGDIPNNERYFPFRSQRDYLSPYIWVKFDVQKNVLVSIVCRAFADNIDSISKVHMRGMMRFKLLVARQTNS